MTGTERSGRGRGGERPGKLGAFVWGGVKIAVAAGIIFGAVRLYRYQIATSPRIGRQKPPPQPKLVQVVAVAAMNRPTTVTGMGTVVPARQVTLRPQVSGRILEVSEQVVPGGFVEAECRLMEIDPRDYDVLVRQREGDLAKAVRDLKLELGSGEVAKHEYDLLDEVAGEDDLELMLRKPHLESAKASEDSAAAALEKAKLDLARCGIAAPFNAIVQAKHVELGATVTLSSDLVTLIATDQAWVEVMVFVHQLKWLDIPKTNGDSGPTVRIENPGVWKSGQFREGRVLRLMGELETEGRLARLLVAVDDPFCLKPENRGRPALLMGSYVTAKINGRTIDSVFPVTRSQLRDNDVVWIMNDAAELEIRPVTIVYRDSDEVYVSEGLTDGERLVVTDIAAPVAGMPLRIEGDTPVSTGAAAADDGGGQ